MTYFAKINEIKERNEYLAAKAVEIARKKGADEAKIVIYSGKGIEVSARHCEVENIEFNQDQGMKVAVSKNKCSGSTSTSDLSLDAIERAIDSALSLSEFTSADEYSGLAESELLFKRSESQSEDSLGKLYECIEDTEEAVKRAVALDTLANEYAKEEENLVGTDGSVYENNYSMYTIATSNDFVDTNIKSISSKGTSILGQSGEEKQRAGYYSSKHNYLDLRSDEYVAKEAVTRTLNKLGARKVETGTYNIVLSRSAVLSFISNFTSSIKGRGIYRKSSFMCDRLNTQVMPSFINIKEDPWVFNGWASTFFDADGVATKPLDVVKDGVLLEYLTGTYSARRLNMANNAHNGESYNWFFSADEAHTRDFDDMLKEIGNGIVVNSVMGQGVDMVSGNYSRGARGYYFENGVRQYAVDEITIAGNLKEMFQKIALVATDYDENSKLHVGSIFLPDMTVSGS